MIWVDRWKVRWLALTNKYVRQVMLAAKSRSASRQYHSRIHEALGHFFLARPARSGIDVMPKGLC